MEAKGRKKYFNIDESISNDQIYALLDNVDSDNEDEIDNLINDSDRYFIVDEETFQLIVHWTIHWPLRKQTFTW